MRRTLAAPAACLRSSRLAPSHATTVARRGRWQAGRLALAPSPPPPSPLFQPRRSLVPMPSPRSSSLRSSSSGTNSKLENQRLLLPEEEKPLLRAMSNGEGAMRSAGPDSDHAPSKDSTLSGPAEAEMEMDSGERRLNELGYKQELRREMTLFKCLAIAFSTMSLFTGIVPLFGSSFLYAGPAGVVWGWVVVTFFTWFVGFAMAEICSSFPTTGSLYFWAAHLSGPKWGPLASWICAWLETIGLIAGIGTQAYAGTQTLQNIILLSTGTNKNGGYLAPRSVFLAIYIGLCLIWAVLNSFALNLIALIDIVSMWWQVVGGTLIIIMVPLVATSTQSASYVFTKLEISSDATGITSPVYSVLLSWLVSQYSLYGYDAAAHLTEETKNADKNGPLAILSSIGMISVFGWAFILALTFSIQDPSYLYDVTNETAGRFVPAQILYDAFYGRYQSSTGAIILLVVIWGSFFFAGLSITTSAARVVYALSRDGGVPYSRLLRKVDRRVQVPVNAVWFSCGFAILLGIPILKLDVVFTAITSICTIGWVGGYAVPIFARMVIKSENFKRGPFHLGRASRVVCLIAFLWICYTCVIFLLPTSYPIKLETFNYAPVALGVVLSIVMGWWVLDARRWFKGPVREIFNIGDDVA